MVQITRPIDTMLWSLEVGLISQVLNVINEPTAAALAYVDLDFGHDNTGRRNVLVFDLGGGTFDVSVVTVEADVVEVKAAAGDDHLGGEDFTSRMAEFFAEQIQRRCVQSPSLLSGVIVAHVDI